MRNSLTLLILSLLICSTSFASLSDFNYYSNEIINDIQKQELRSVIKEKLREAISKGQVRNTSYKTARKNLFGKIFLQEDQNGLYVKDVYCEETLREEDGIGHFKIPDHKEMNCEHGWPQSKFSRSFSKGLQKTDLHHLFPVNSRANSSRGNINFGEVSGAPLSSSCRNSYRGVALGTNTIAFEPPTEIKGDVARAIFYFSTRYNLKIVKFEEQALRNWHNMDPVDKFERKRHEMIYKIQKNRNPFIDQPNLVTHIQDF